MSNLAADTYESLHPPSCASLDAEDLELRLDELYAQFKDDELQREDVKVPAAKHHQTAETSQRALSVAHFAVSLFHPLLSSCVYVQAELGEQERALRRSVHDERLRKVKLESVRHTLIDKSALAQLKTQMFNVMVAAAPPQSEEEKGHTRIATAGVAA